MPAMHWDLGPVPQPRAGPVAAAAVLTYRGWAELVHRASHCPLALAGYQQVGFLGIGEGTATVLSQAISRLLLVAEAASHHAVSTGSLSSS